MVTYHTAYKAAYKYAHTVYGLFGPTIYVSPTVEVAPTLTIGGFGTSMMGARPMGDDNVVIPVGDTTAVPPRIHNIGRQFATIIAHRLGGVLD
jgi:hypothetical protein